MKQKFYCLLSFSFGLLAAFVAMAQSQKAPVIVWQKTIGGNGTDSLSALCIGKDKSVIMCGSSNSAISGNKTEDSIGAYDLWVVKTDSSGNILWNKTLGGTKNDIASAIINTSDGGYLVGGSSISDVSGSKSHISFGSSYDYWVLKLDSNGNKLWDVTLGGIYTERLTSLTELPSGNYVAGGFSYSDATGIKTTLNIGSENTADYWILVLGNDGSVVSQSIFGGTSDDALSCVSPLGTNSIYSAGSSYSLKYHSYKTISPAGNNDYWIVRSDLLGNKQYEGDFGSDRSDYLTCMQVFADTSLILGGYSNSDASSVKTQGFLGVTDYWVVKLNPNGTKQWDKTIGGSSGDYLVSVQQTKDKGFLLGGYSNSNIGDNKTENSKGGFDYWIVKTDSLGNILWDKTIGGNGDDLLAGAYETDSNKYIIAGTSYSAQSGDKTTGTIGSTGAADYWLLSLDGNNNSVLPLSILSFTEKTQQQDVWLNWVVTNQINVSHFEVERSTDNVTFYQTAIVTAVNTTGEKTYQSIDSKAALLPFDKLYYRLKIINSDGSFSYSNIIPVQLASLTATDFKIVPDPVKNSLTVRYNVKESSKADFIIYSSTGKPILKVTLPANAGINTHTFNVASLSKGVYYAVMYADEKKMTKMFVKE